MLKKLFLRKKMIATMIGLLCGFLAVKGFDIPDGVREALLEFILVVVGSFNIGQGISDGLSKGKTSASARFNDED